MNIINNMMNNKNINKMKSDNNIIVIFNKFYRDNTIPYQFTYKNNIN